MDASSTRDRLIEALARVLVADLRLSVDEQLVQHERPHAVARGGRIDHLDLADDRVRIVPQR